MPTIRVDDDVFQGLKAIAEPFTDTPNSVIRKLLSEYRGLQSKGARPSEPATKQPETAAAKPSPGGQRVQQPVYEHFLLYVLGREFSGAASKHDATRRVLELMESRGLLHDVDREHVSTGETRAANTTAWARNALKEQGLISQVSGRGIWELTAEGRRKAQRLELP